MVNVIAEWALGHTIISVFRMQLLVGWERREEVEGSRID